MMKRFLIGLLRASSFFALLVLFGTEIYSRPGHIVWRDRSTHNSGFVRVNGVRLHYLDWGGKGQALVFLPGFRDNAHIFDDIAPKFVPQFHVLALTRRGHGQSDKPEGPYDMQTIVEDIRGFLDQMNIKRANLVGHSRGGAEMDRFAIRYPERVLKLVYLESHAGGTTESDAVIAKLDVSLPMVAPSKQVFDSWSEAREYRKKDFGFWTPAMEANLRDRFARGSDGKLHETAPPYALQAYRRDIAHYDPEFTKITAPSLAIYAFLPMKDWIPPNADDATRKKVEVWWQQYMSPYLQQQVDRFKAEMRNGQTVGLSNTSHYLFLDKQVEVARLIKRFLLSRRS